MFAAPIWPKKTGQRVMLSQEKMLPLEKVFNHRGLWVPILVAAILVKVKFLKKFVICCPPNKQNIARPNSRKGRLSSYKRGGVSFLVHRLFTNLHHICIQTFRIQFHLLTNKKLLQNPILTKCSSLLPD